MRFLQRSDLRSCGRLAAGSKAHIPYAQKLGITYVAVNSITAELNNIEHTGLRVESVATDSDLYGRISKGDIITHINGTAIMEPIIIGLERAVPMDWYAVLWNTAEYI